MISLNPRRWLRTLYRWWRYTRRDDHVPVKPEWRDYLKNGDEQR